MHALPSRQDAAPPPATEPLLALQLARLKRDFVEDLWRGMVVVAGIGVPISLSRSAISGWQPVYASHVVLALVVIWGLLQTLGVDIVKSLRDALIH